MKTVKEFMTLPHKTVMNGDLSNFNCYIGAIRAIKYDT